MSYRPTYNKNNNTKFWRWNNYQCYLVVILPLMVIPYLYRYFLNQGTQNISAEQKAKNYTIQAENKDPNTLQQNLDKITTSASIQGYARELGFTLGTYWMTRNDSSILGQILDATEPRGWFEDDKRTADIVIYQRLNYQKLAKCYALLTRNNDLTNDLINYLDSDQLARVRKYVKI